MTHPKFVEGEMRIVGQRWSPRAHAIKQFLARSRVPYRWLDVEGDPAARAVATAALPPGGDDRLPVVLLPDGSVLADPDVRTVAQKLGLPTEPEARLYDLIIVGGGPAGLTASINAASEGLRTVVVEQDVPGGQAGCSPSIENYPGFPEGLSGGDLARRTVQQAERFGVEILVTRRATRLRADGEHRLVALDDGTELAARSVLLATGVTFRWLDAPGCVPLVGAGIYYGAVTAEASTYKNQEIYILGGGNSAGQAALLLARYARRVILLAHEDSLEETMSQYLVERIRRTENITVRTGHTVVGAEGQGRLERLVIKNTKTGATEGVAADGLFVFIGATPRTEWLEGAVARDQEGFVLSGVDFMCDGIPEWPDGRRPYLLESSMQGVFVAGDARKGSVKRLTSAAGEGAMCVALIHRYFREGIGAAVR
jgi:thioredoxin reductase (NADPH)